MDEPRAILKKGDSLLASGDARAAMAAYTSVAQFYAKQGFALKAVAIWKQVRAIAVREHEATIEADARAQLVTLYRSLGLTSDAEALEKE
ncbi:MAG TPA: hypothetical protein VH054_29760 [Polyangiaceae bacterium]|jgi:outer membrane protein assembly factor BamD (BamD/ComL family)|nr:hypothetical protein [Polyangiaceae bacterium]